MSTNDLWRLTATHIATHVRRRDISAREAAASALARLDQANPALNAVVDHRPEETLAAADAIDARIARGEDPGPLAGVPVTIKANTDQAGHATTNGLTIQRDHIAAEDNPVVSNLRRAGAVILGRTNTPAFSYRWFTGNRLYGTTRNPRDPVLTPGGSSGGAAACVAAGIGALAQGTDIAGSIRYPAYACGVHGLRPTPGRVAAHNPSLPERGIGPQLTAVSGPIARTVADLGLALAAMAAPDMRDPWWTPAPLDGPAAPRRVAFCLRPDGLQTAPDIVAALTDAALCLAAAGWSVEEVQHLPPLREAAEIQTRLWMGDGYDAMRAAAEREGDEGALTVLRFHEATARAMDMAGYSRALARRNAIVREWRVFLDRTPAVLLPVSAELPFPNDLDLQGDDAFARVWEAQMTQIALPVIGMPGLALSTRLCGTAPVGVQIIANRFREDVCLAAAQAIEAGGTPPSPV